MFSIQALVTIGSVLATFVASIYIYFTWTFDYWKKRNIPHGKPTFIVGSLTNLFRRSPTEFFIEINKKFPTADYFGIWLFRTPALIVKSPELAKRILVKDFEYFRDRFVTSGKTDPIGALNIFTAKDPLWSVTRKRLTPVFTAAKLRGLTSITDAYSQELVKRIHREHVQQNKPVDLRDLLSCLTTDLIGTSAFGVKGESVRTNDSPLRRVTREISTFTWRRGIEFTSIFFIPSLVDVFRFKFFTPDMSEFFRRLFWKVYQQRITDPSVQKSKDLLDALIDIRKDAKASGEEIDDDVLVAQAAIFVQGGFDTTAVSLSYFFLELAHHPKIQQRLYEEIQEANPIIDGSVNYSIVKDLPYLATVMKEILRKYPAMGFLDRVCDRDYKLDDHLVIRKGTPIYVNAVGMHYDEKYFPEPTMFDPERFSPDNEKNIVPFSYLPFGEGPRNCIGMRMALQSMKIIITHTLFNFEIRPKPGQPRPNEMGFEPKGVFLGPDRVIDLQFVPRKP